MINHGGKREKSGRKPVEDKKVPVCVYTPISRVNKLGMDNIKEMTLNLIEKEYKKK